MIIVIEFGITRERRLVELFSIPQARQSLSSLITFWHKLSFRPRANVALTSI